MSLRTEFKVKNVTHNTCFYFRPPNINSFENSNTQKYDISKFLLKIDAVKSSSK